MICKETNHGEMSIALPLNGLRPAFTGRQAQRRCYEKPKAGNTQNKKADLKSRLTNVLKICIMLPQKNDGNKESFQCLCSN